MVQEKWVHYLTRPFTLLGASLWQRWYDSDKIQEMLGVSLSNSMFVEEHPGVMRRYALSCEFDKFQKAIKEFVLNNPRTCQEIIKKGLEINKKIEILLDEKCQLDFEEAVNFFIEMQLYTTFFPYFIYKFSSESKNKELLDLTGKLRAVSYYPRFLKNIFIPAAVKKTGLGEEEVNLTTISEIRSNKTKVAAERKRLRTQGKLFIYQAYPGKESVEMVDDITKIVSKLEQVKITDQITGTVAYPGKVKGAVRLVLTSDPNIHFKKGDVLVSPSTNPDLVPLFYKAAAVVTDEGGLMSHAAVICREMKIPCLVGTKIATRAFKDDDYVEVDAEKGIVRKLYK